MRRLETADDLARAVEGLIGVEPRFATVVDRHGLPALRHAAPGLEALLRIITDQLISLRAGEAIWQRLASRLGGCTPAEVLDVAETELQALGLTRAKARSFHAAARVFAEERRALTGFAAEEDTRRLLLAITGVGPWTADIYLLTVLRSADAWPAADLALQVAVQDIFDLAERPSSRTMTALAEPWRPWRSAAALLLWRHYRHVRAMAG